MKQLFNAFFISIILFVDTPFAQEKIDPQIIQRIKKEGLENSKVTEYLSYLTDIYATRLAGSQQYGKAGQWIVEKLKELGIENAQMESFNLNGRGWELKKFYMAMTKPQYMPLIAYPKAWTPGTQGLIKSNPVLMIVKKAEDLEQFKGKLKGVVVFTDDEVDLQTSFEPDAEPQRRLAF